jgi:hypothetical protein
VAGPSAAQTPAVELDALDGPSPFLTDTNGDGLADDVPGRIVLPDAATTAEATAAANIAARLGYETVAADLDPIRRRSELPTPIEQPVILVGAGAGEPGTDSENENRLGPGEGRIAAIAPDTTYTAGALRIVGGDGSGLLAAANYASGRLPSLWTLEGTTVEDATGSVREALSEEGVSVRGVRVRHVTVGRDRPGVHALGLSVDVADEEAAKTVRSVLDAEEGTTEGHPLHLPNVHTVVTKIAHPGGTLTLRVRPETEWNPESVSDAERSVERTPELHELYSLDGLYDDTNHDFVPDDVVGAVSYAGSAAVAPVSALAMHIGLETAGARWPLVRPAGASDQPEEHGLPVLVGVDHPVVDALRADGAIPGAKPDAGEGLLQLVENGPEEDPAFVLSGGDAEGLARVADYTATGLPYLGGHGKGTFELTQIDTQVRRFIQGKSGAGQVAAGLEKLDTWLNRLDEAALDSLHVTLAADSVPQGVGAYIQEQVSSIVSDADDDVEIATHPTRFGMGETILDQEWEIPWEGDTFWTMFREQVLPAMESGEKGRIELRLSEGPEQRARLARQVNDALAEQGVDTTDVVVDVLSAYKQGYSWLVDQVKPAVADKEVGKIKISYHTLKESEEVQWQLVNANTRWLQELYPVDAVLARDLGLPDSMVTFEKRWAEEPIYSVEVQGPGGEVLHTDTFNPKYTVRPYVHHFPQHDSVRVPTGWLRAEVGGETIVDRRIKTDLERFWEKFQGSTVPKIVDYTMDIQDGDPHPENAPFFDELRMEVELSEPDYRLGIQRHSVSATEALHEDLYFHGLTLFTLLGNRYNVGPLDYPGRILPQIQPPTHGEPGHAEIKMTGKSHADPSLRLAYTTEAGRHVVDEYPLPNIENVPAPELRALRAQTGQSGLSRLRFDVETEADTSVYQAMKRRGSEADIDRAFPSSERLQGMATHLQALHDRGLFTKTLSYDRVEALALRFETDDSTSTHRTALLPQTDAPRSTTPPALPAPNEIPDGEPIVQWETPIPPGEANQLMGTLSHFPEVHPYYMETSFLGHDMFAMDLRVSHGGDVVSQAALNAQRPAVYLNAREDGNEVSSTSYTLRLAEQVATDPEMQAYLDSVDVTILPVKNPDGAQVAYDRYKVNPDHMLHAGYYAALGPSLGDQAQEEDPLYPASTVKPELRRSTLPDIFMNLHGYPHHEWVQYFSGYSAWVFSRNGTSRSWWPTRGYFLTGFDWAEDSDHPELETAAFTVLDSMTTALSKRDRLMERSKQEYERYRKYLAQGDEYGEYFRNGVRVHSALKGEEVDDGPPSSVRDRRITPFSITPEAQDETAYGDWLKLQAGAGLTAVKSAIRYLYEGRNEVHHRAETKDGAVRRWVYREKPVLPPEAAENSEE